jgi:hypothetical protein
MSPNFIRNLLIYTISNVTGSHYTEIAETDELLLNTRDWEQIISRLEATLDIQTGLLTSPGRTISIGAMTNLLYGLTGENIFSDPRMKLKISEPVR